MRRRAWLAPMLAFAASSANAHGFGQRYDLPLPLELYVSGAAAVVVVSCVLFALFLRVAPVEREDSRGLRMPAGLTATARLVAVAAFLLLLGAGFIGNQSPFRNVVPVTVWALWWVGFAYVSALLGDLWKIVNPLDTLFAPFERLSLRWAYPKRLASWPAFVLYLAFLWMEIAWEGSDSPRAMATAIAAYSLVTWTGMWVFGREDWLDRGEVFSVVFATFARFAPLKVVASRDRAIVLHPRPYAVGLLEREPLDASRIALVIAILAGVSFDGFLETPAWEALEWPRVAGLLFVPALFAAIYLVFCRLIAVGGGLRDSASVRRIAGLFVLTLVPIAIAYEIAHYLSFLAQAGQYIIPLVSDPFGWGWNLFGTANYFVRIAVIDARLVWTVSVIAIVAGHVAAIYVGHVLAPREFPSPRAAVRSQGPMLVLMVAYTMLSLWIIAQPIVSTR